MEAYRSWVSGMKQYQPPPQDLSRLNPIQRYLHKGSLDWSDYGRLVFLVVIYWFLRPHIQKIVKRWSQESQGEEEREAYDQRREDAKVSANSIRSGKALSQGKTIGQVLDEGVDGRLGTTSATASETRNEESDLKNRTQQKGKKGASITAGKSVEDKRLDWEDDSQFDPAFNAASNGDVQPERNDIKEWMEKWTA